MVGQGRVGLQERIGQGIGTEEDGRRTEKRTEDDCETHLCNLLIQNN